MNLLPFLAVVLVLELHGVDLLHRKVERALLGVFGNLGFGRLLQFTVVLFALLNELIDVDLLRLYLIGLGLHDLCRSVYQHLLEFIL